MNVTNSHFNGTSVNIKDMFLFTQTGCELHNPMLTMNFCLLLIIKPALAGWLANLEYILNIFEFFNKAL